MFPLFLVFLLWYSHQCSHFKQTKLLFLDCFYLKVLSYQWDADIKCNHALIKRLGYWKLSNIDLLRSWLWADGHLRHKHKLSVWVRGEDYCNNYLSDINMIKSSEVLWSHLKNKVMASIFLRGAKGFKSSLCRVFRDAWGRLDGITLYVPL